MLNTIALWLGYGALWLGYSVIAAVALMILAIIVEEVWCFIQAIGKGFRKWRKWLTNG